MNGPIDLTDVEGDDVAFSALGRGEMPTGLLADDPVMRMLFEWREDIARDVPDEPVQPVKVGRRFGIAVAAVVVSIGSLGGVAAAASTATPDSVLWPVTKIVYDDRAHSLEAKDDVEVLLAKAEREAKNGRTEQAANYIQQALSMMDDVREADGATQLEARAQALSQQVIGGNTGNSGEEEESPITSPTNGSSEEESEPTPNPAPTSEAPAVPQPTQVAPSVSPTPSNNTKTTTEKPLVIGGLTNLLGE